MRDLLASAVQEPGQNKASASRLFLVLAAISFIIVFVNWQIIMVGLFFHGWEWSRYEGAIVTGGIGLLGVIFGGVGSYSVNRWTSRRQSVEETFEGHQDPRPPIED